MTISVTKVISHRFARGVVPIAARHWTPGPNGLPRSRDRVRCRRVKRRPAARLHKQSHTSKCLSTVVRYFGERLVPGGAAVEVDA